MKSDWISVGGDWVGICLGWICALHGLCMGFGDFWPDGYLERRLAIASLLFLLPFPTLGATVVFDLVFEAVV